MLRSFVDSKGEGSPKENGELGIVHAKHEESGSQLESTCNKIICYACNSHRIFSSSICQLCFWDIISSCNFNTINFEMTRWWKETASDLTMVAVFVGIVLGALAILGVSCVREKILIANNGVTVPGEKFPSIMIFS